MFNCPYSASTTGYFMFRSYVKQSIHLQFFRYYIININIVCCIIIITVVSYWVLQNPIFFFSLIGLQYPRHSIHFISKMNRGRNPNRLYIWCLTAAVEAKKFRFLSPYGSFLSFFHIQLYNVTLKGVYFWRSNFFFLWISCTHIEFFKFWEKCGKVYANRTGNTWYQNGENYGVKNLITPCSLPYITRVLKSGSMRWAGNVARVKAIKNYRNISVRT
jgi:hypothetical protein